MVFHQYLYDKLEYLQENSNTKGELIDHEWSLTGEIWKNGQKLIPAPQENCCLYNGILIWPLFDFSQKIRDSSKNCS